VNDEQINDDEQLARDAFSTLTFKSLDKSDDNANSSDIKELIT